jgi:hypothetical protein
MPLANQIFMNVSSIYRIQVNLLNLGKLIDDTKKHVNSTFI